MVAASLIKINLYFIKISENIQKGRIKFFIIDHQCLDVYSNVK